MFSFAKRKTKTQVEGVLRRIADCTTPNLVTFDGEERLQNRHNRTIPILLTPKVGQSWAPEETIFGLTKDIADGGVSLVLTQPIESAEVIVTFWLIVRQVADATPVMLQGHVCHCRELGGGYWQAGIMLHERFQDVQVVEQIMPQAVRLLPEALRQKLFREKMACS